MVFRDNVTVAPKQLLGNDDLTILVEPAVGAHVVRELHGTAAGAHGTCGGGDLHVRGATGMRLSATLFLLRYCHVDLPY